MKRRGRLLQNLKRETKRNEVAELILSTTSRKGYKLPGRMKQKVNLW